jgi:hypothetical protein
MRPMGDSFGMVKFPDVWMASAGDKGHGRVWIFGQTWHAPARQWISMEL